MARKKSKIKKGVSIVIPYMHSEERFKLLLECLVSLPREFEICIHEIGKERGLPEIKYCKYLFTEFHGIFHRAWAINVGVRELATREKIIIIDADVVIPTAEWVSEVNACQYPSVAWGTMHYLTEESTKDMLKRNNKEIDFERTKTPRFDGPAGGITCIDREVFVKMKGVPEMFENTWGGEDNVFFAKLITLGGYKFRYFRSPVMHLWHSKSTPRDNSQLKNAWNIMLWSKKQWQDELDRIGDNWGKVEYARRFDSE